MDIKEINDKKGNKQKLAEMVIEFRRYLASLKDKKDKMTIKEAVEEINYYLNKEYPIYVAENKNNYFGYFILKYDDDAVWLEHFFVKEEYRKNKIGTKLFNKAEKLLDELGYVNLYNWVHPNNDRMIHFLKNQGYNVLNMIEIRKKSEKENLDTKIKVGEHEFEYNI